MSCRSSSAEVKKIIETDLDVDPFIRTASVVVDRLITYAEDNPLEDSELKEIEIYLAAHFCTLREQQYDSKSTADASAKFQGKTGMGLASSHYGQTAKILDSSGYLDSLDKPNKPEAGVIFTGLDYTDSNNTH